MNMDISLLRRTDAQQRNHNSVSKRHLHTDYRDCVYLCGSELTSAVHTHTHTHTHAHTHTVMEFHHLKSNLLTNTY